MILARKIKKSKDFLQIFGMWKHFLDILWNSDKIWWSCSANRRENCKILTMLFDENFLKYWGLSGAKACKSCRSRQELSNEYFVAKFGVDTEENEPCKVCSFGWKIRERFDIEPFNWGRAAPRAPSLSLGRRSPTRKLKGSISNLTLIFQPNDQTI